MYDRAESLMRQHQWEQGLAALQPLLQTRPASARVLNLAGLACTGKGDPARGNEYFEAALRAEPAFAPALKNLAINEYGLQDFAAAERHLLAAAKLAPEDPVVHLYLGQLAFRRADYIQASEHLQRAGTRFVSDPKVRYPLAVSLLKTSGKDGALALLEGLPAAVLTARDQFTLAVALDEADLPAPAIPYLEAVLHSYPAASDIAYDLALCEVQAKQFPQAIATVRKLIADGHESAPLDNMLAEALKGDHQTQPAVDALRRAISLDPEDDDNYLDFASLCIDHQAFADAAKVLVVGLGVHPRSARLVFERGVLHALQDHFEQAEKDFEDAAVLAPQDNSGYIGLGVAYMETGKSGMAAEVLRKRIAQQPKDAHLLYLLGEALIHAGAKSGDPTYTEAQAALEQSLRLDPNLGAARSALGTIYLEENRLLEAVEQLEQARRLNRKDKAAYSHLAVAYRRLGGRDKARETLMELEALNEQERGGARERSMANSETAFPPGGVPQ